MEVILLIYIIEGPPRNFKTVFATMIALDSMKSSGSDKVFTSWPVYSKKLGKFTKQWRREYVFENIYDSTIIIDEAYMMYPSRGAGGKYVKYTEETVEVKDDSTGEIRLEKRYGFVPGMTKEEHLMFATNGQNGNDFYFIAQNASRLDTILRELYNVIYHCRRKDFPIITRIMDYAGIDLPWKAEIRGYEDESFVNAGDFCEQADMYNLPFSKLRRVFKSYNTHYFRKKGEMRNDYHSWTPEDDVKQYILAQTGGVDERN